jgi:hypothetical protein
MNLTDALAVACLAWVHAALLLLLTAADCYIAMPLQSNHVVHTQDEFLSQRVDLIAEDQCGNVFIDPRCVLTSIHMNTERYCACHYCSESAAGSCL